MSQRLFAKSGDRLAYIDFLKVVGLTGIVIAHVGSPNWLMMLRSFDVPLMVILSSLLGRTSYEKYTNEKSAMSYYISRFKRLVFPTWIFLIIYFFISFLFKGTAKSIKFYIASFAMTRYGIGYVWIILVYLYSAMLIPIFAKLKKKIQGLLIVIILYIFYEIAYYLQLELLGNHFVQLIIDTTLYYIIPYGLVTYLGYNYVILNKKMKILIISSSLLIFFIFAVYIKMITGNFQLVQIAKYPPRAYYLSYGIFGSFTTIFFCEKNDFKIFSNRMIRFISSHSMWIYLWHVLVLQIYIVFKLPDIWYVKFLVVYFVSMIIVIFINMFLDLISQRINLSFLKYLRG